MQTLHLHRKLSSVLATVSHDLDEQKHVKRYSSNASLLTPTELIDARGTNEPQGVSTMFYPMIQNILANMTGGVSLPVEYPAAPDQNTTSGKKLVVDTIVQGLRDCPNQKYGLFGYSQGATLMLGVLDQFSPSTLESIKSVIIVGNPYRIPGKISNVNATAQHDEDASVGMSAEKAGGSKDIPQLSREIDQSGKVLDYCLEVSSRYISIVLLNQ